MTPSFAGFPLGVTSGTYDHTFDLTSASAYNDAFITASGGTISDALNALAFGLDAGTAYLDIHTGTFAGGEIRAFLTPAPVPLPASAWLLLSGLVGMAIVGRRQSWSRRC
jgi:hypothetical protein